MPRRSFNIILFFSLCVICSFTSARAEEESEQRQSRVTMAVIDVTKTLRRASQSQVDELRKELEVARKRFEKEQDSLSLSREKLKAYHELGSAEHTKLKLEVLRLEGEIEARWQVAREQFLLGRASAYQESYEAMQAETKKFMTKHDLDLVLRTKTPRLENWLREDGSTSVDLLSLPSRWWPEPA